MKLVGTLAYRKVLPASGKELVRLPQLNEVDLGLAVRAPGSRRLGVTDDEGVFRLDGDTGSSARWHKGPQLPVPEKGGKLCPRGSLIGSATNTREWLRRSLKAASKLLKVRKVNV